MDTTPLLIPIYVVLAMALFACQPKADRAVAHGPRKERWSAKQAQAWYAHNTLGWVGCNFNPSTAVNQLEFWRAWDFDPDYTIDRELRERPKASASTAMRVYLHDQAYEQDPQGFLDRIDQYLQIADRHEIVTLFVIFDDCWRPDFQPDQVV